MAYLNLASATKTSRSSALNTAIGGSAVLVIYTGTIPTNPDTAISGNTVLATFTCASGSFGSSSSGVLTAGTIPQVNATATGTATWARIYTAGGSVGIVDADVGTSGATITINTTTITTGGPVQITSATFTEN